MAASLPTVLTSIDWAKNVAEFIAATDVVNAIEAGCHHISVWNAELSFQDIDCPALAFLQEMKASLFFVPACMAVGLYKPAASSMRAAVENALYYTYFRSHASELRTLAQNTKYYVSKRQIIDFHSIHTPEFKTKQQDVGFVDQLEAWYSAISSIVHGQIPGVWSSKSLKDSSFSYDLSLSAKDQFEKAVHLIRYLFLLTTPVELWEGMNPVSRTLFLKGLPGQHKAVFALPLV